MFICIFCILGEHPEVLYQTQRSSEQADIIPEIPQCEPESISFHQSEKDLPNTDAYCDPKDITSRTHTISVAQKSKFVFIISRHI